MGDASGETPNETCERAAAELMARRRELLKDPNWGRRSGKAALMRQGVSTDPQTLEQIKQDARSYYPQVGITDLTPSMRWIYAAYDAGYLKAAIYYCRERDAMFPFASHAAWSAFCAYFPAPAPEPRAKPAHGIGRVWSGGQETGYLKP